jgi:endonuclease/exonuclease/phosphatase family metal-dependent hydrolase
MGTNSHAPRKGATILIGVAIGSAALAWGAQGQPTPQPDLTVSVNAAPNPVPFGVGYEVEIIVANTIPPSPPPETPVAPPDGPVPPDLADRETEPDGEPRVAVLDPARGADVQQADLLLGTNVPTRPVTVQTQPPLDMNCRATSPGESTWRCAIGPLMRGGRWTITFVYPNPRSPATASTETQPAISHTATIDDLGTIDERDETNNSGGVSVNFEVLAAALDLITPRGLVSAPPSTGNQLATVFVDESISLLGVGRSLLDVGRHGASGIKCTSIIKTITRSCGNLQTGLSTNGAFSNRVDAGDCPPSESGPRERSESGPQERFVQDRMLVEDLLGSCGPDETFRTLNFSAHVTAENYHGGSVTTGDVSFPITPFRVGTFNLQALETHPDLSEDAALSRAGLLVQEADVVFLQEVDDDSQATALANKSGLRNVHYYEDLAILSRFPLSNVVEQEIPDIDTYVLDATISVEDMTIRLLNSHFPYSSCYQGENEHLRVAAAQFVLSLIEQTPNLPIIFGADINGTRGNPEVNLLLNKLRDAALVRNTSLGASVPESVRCSFPKMIDFVFVKGPFRTVAFESVCPDPHPSDHPFVWHALALARTGTRSGLPPSPPRRCPTGQRCCAPSGDPIGISCSLCLPLCTEYPDCPR